VDYVSTILLGIGNHLKLIRLEQEKEQFVLSIQADQPDKQLDLWNIPYSRLSDWQVGRPSLMQSSDQMSHNSSSDFISSNLTSPANQAMRRHKSSEVATAIFPD
jgi:hypothetical protein